MKKSIFEQISEKVTGGFEQVSEKVTDGILFVVKAGINEERSVKRIQKLRAKFNTLPKDHLAQILIKHAVNKTAVEGFASGVVISGCEAVDALPLPEAGQRIVATGGAIASLFSDATFTTKVQLQLVYDLAAVYGCPYDKDDEDDVWLIFKAALGLKGTEKAVGYGRVLFTEAGKKQFRKILRAGLIRKALQEKLVDFAGKKVAKVLAEKYVLRLIPIANMAIGAIINNRVTNSVGKWAKTKAKGRSSTFKNIDKLVGLSREKAILALPILFYVSTADDRLTDNESVLYAQTEKRLALSELEKIKISAIVEDDTLAILLKEELINIPNEEIKKGLFEIALTAAAINLAERDGQHDCLVELSGILGISYERKMLSERIRYLKL